MRPSVTNWFQAHSTSAALLTIDNVLATKGNHRISVVVPARNEESTIGDIVRSIHTHLMLDVPLVDELVVLDSDSTDDTCRVARDAGAVVHSSKEIRADLGSYRGKGEAIWKSLFVTSGDLVVFVDGDVTNFQPSFVYALCHSLLIDSGCQIVKGYYDRDFASANDLQQGGRVTELTARPILNLWWPELAGVVQPLAGEWAARRDFLENISIPIGYGVEIATLIDAYERFGLDGIRQVDLGKRDHRHQDLHGLGRMAAEILMTADRRRSTAPAEPPFEISHFAKASSDDHGTWVSAEVPTHERPPARSEIRTDATCSN